MSIQTACHVSLARDRPKCPRCDGVLFVAEESRFNVRGRIDHAWACDDCGHEFVTSIVLCHG
jgi:uncharacterized protein with PIN domain